MKKINEKIIISISILILAFNNIRSQSVSKNEIQTKIETSQNQFKIDTDIKIVFTITNNSDKEYKFCYWQTPLEKSFTSDFFEIKFEDKIIEYSGVMIKRGSPHKSDYFFLKPKQSISEEINLRDGYNINKQGIYKIRFKGSQINNLQNSNQIEISIN